MIGRTRVSRAASVLLAAMLAAAACTSGGDQTDPVAACRSATPAPTPPPPATNPRPGDVRWSLIVDRCTGTPSNAWADLRGVQLGAIVAGTAVFLDLSGTVRRYDLRTGKPSWQRSVVAPTKNTYLDELRATQDLVMVAFTVTPGPAKYTFLDAATGQPVGAVNQALTGVPLLVGAHVVVDTGDQLQGYDPRAGETTWQDPVTRLPAAATVQDDITVYLPPGAGGSDGIGRVDAATGRVLAPLQLPRAPRLDPASTELDGVGQGLLALGKTSAQPASSAPGQPIGYPIVLSVVVDSGTGATVWARNGNVAASDAGPFSTFDANSHTYTAVDPRTGQDLWSVSDPGLGTVGGPHPLVALPDYLVQGIEADPQDNGGEVAGVPPAGSEATHAAWHSVPLIRPQLVAVDQDTAVVSTCDPWANPVLSKLCADRALVAIAI